MHPGCAPNVAFDVICEQLKQVNKTSLALGVPARLYSRKHLEFYSATYSTGCEVDSKYCSFFSSLFRLQIATARRPNHDQMENLL